MSSVQQALQGILGSDYAASAATQQTASTGQTSTSKSNSLDMNAFLTMFMTQLKYQDPTNPLESYELAAQLAQFSTVEQLSKANENLTEVQSYLSSLNNAEMINMIGKDVVGLDNTIKVTGGKATNASYTIDAPADVTVKIYDAEGSLVRTMTATQAKAGQFDVNWDGRNDAGATVSDGTYSCEVDATDADGNALNVTVSIKGTVHAFRMEQGAPYLVLDGEDGVTLSPSEIKEVTASGTTA